jgi:hypothetical protein
MAAFDSFELEAECCSYYCGVGLRGLLRSGAGDAGAEEREGEGAGGDEWRLQGIETVFEGEDIAATAVAEGGARECDVTTEVMGAAAGGVAAECSAEATAKYLKPKNISAKAGLGWEFGE